MAKIGIRFAPGEKPKVSKGKTISAGSGSAQDGAPPAPRPLPPGLRPWQPGQSGNPSGKRPMPPEVIEALLAGSEAAAKRLAELVMSNNEKVALAASETLLSRLYGKPTQSVDANVAVTDVAQIHLQHLQEIQARRAERMKTIEGDTQIPAEITTQKASKSSGPADPV